MNTDNQINKPFDDDLLNLSRLATLWTNALIDIDNNFVIGIILSGALIKALIIQGFFCVIIYITSKYILL